jgi:hypothetical protein
MESLGWHRTPLLRHSWVPCPPRPLRCHNYRGWTRKICMLAACRIGIVVIKYNIDGYNTRVPAIRTSQHHWIANAICNRGINVRACVCVCTSSIVAYPDGGHWSWGSNPSNVGNVLPIQYIKYKWSSRVLLYCNITLSLLHYTVTVTLHCHCNITLSL